MYSVFITISYKAKIKNIYSEVRAFYDINPEKIENLHEGLKNLDKLMNETEIEIKVEEYNYNSTTNHTFTHETGYIWRECWNDKRNYKARKSYRNNLGEDPDTVLVFKDLNKTQAIKYLHEIITDTFYKCVEYNLNINRNINDETGTINLPESTIKAKSFLNYDLLLKVFKACTKNADKTAHAELMEFYSKKLFENVYRYETSEHKASFLLFSFKNTALDYLKTSTAAEAETIINYLESLPAIEAEAIA